MGLPKVTTKLANPGAPERSYEAVFLVDTGATDSLAPQDELERIALESVGIMVDPVHKTLKRLPAIPLK